MARGDLVPSSMIVAMLRRKLRGKGSRLLLDGFHVRPRMQRGLPPSAAGLSSHSISSALTS